jgi:hypothetical protein
MADIEPKRIFEMNASYRSQLAAFAAAMFCAFIMIGTSVAPAIQGGIA